MIDRNTLKRDLAGVLAGLACIVVSTPVLAQSLPYRSSTGGGSPRSAIGDDGDAPTVRRGGQDNGSGRRQVRFNPYIEATQVVSAELAPTREILTWSGIAAGVEASVGGRNTQGSVSIRYERRFGWGRAGKADALSGVARTSVAVIPRALSVEAGALATRTTVDGRGAAVPGDFNGKSSTNLYSVYAGPAVKTQLGAVAVNGSYRLGYNKVGSSETLRSATAPANFDTFDSSVTHNAQLRAGVRPGEVLPVGVGVGAGYAREDISNLDQRVQDLNARADVTLPVSSSLALVAGVGYEDVQVSGRDALRDATGQPVRGSNGRTITDKSVPRKIAYAASGLTWDGGLTWRPSARTALEAHVGRRYGSMTYYGSFGWRPSGRTALNLSVYDSISGFGGQLNQALVDLPTEFDALRNPITGNLNGCVNGTGTAAQAPTGGPCLTGALGSLRSAVFRGRGVQASYAAELGRLGMGLAAGYDRRRFIGAPGTILATVNGVVDENTWLSAWLSGKFDERTSFSTYVYGSWFRSNQAVGADGKSIGANALFSREFGNRISANATFGVQGQQRDAIEDQWQASALLGLRYTFF